MSEKQVKYLPYHAINEFMLDDYRHEVILTVFSRFNELSAGRKGALVNLVKRHVQVQGFRNSSQAPLMVKVKGSGKPFQTSAEYAANVVAGWCELHPDLGAKVYELLTSRGWEILPVDADRTKLPGFIPAWPKDETFEAINAAFKEKYPDEDIKDYDVSLMVVWLSGRLPFDLE